MFKCCVGDKGRSYLTEDSPWSRLYFSLQKEEDVITSTPEGTQGQN